MDRHQKNNIDSTVMPRNDARRDDGRDIALIHLHDTDDFEIADGEPDIRGWDVKSTEGRKLGEVKDLLVDTGEMRVRYMEVKLDKDVARDADRAEQRFVLIPVGAARLHEKDDEVLVDMKAANMPDLPNYTRGKLTREYETSLLDRFRVDGKDSMSDRDTSNGDFYGRRHFDDERFFGGRRSGRERESYITRPHAGSRR